MNPSEEIQWDLEKAPPGGTFLVLNLGTNTVDLGSSCFFQTFPPVAVRSVSPLKVRPSEAPCPVSDGSDENVVEKIAPVAAGGCGSAVSTDEGPALPEKPTHRRTKAKDDDPDWTTVPRESGSSVRREDANSSEKAPCRGGNANASTSAEENPPPGSIEVRQEQQDGLPQSSDGGENGMVSSMEGPPMYLVQLLQFYGWTVSFHRGHGAVYTSPKGVAYHSLRKAFETFLHDSTKGEEQESSQTQTLDGGGMGAPDLNLPTGLSTEGVVKESSKGRRGRKRKKGAGGRAKKETSLHDSSKCEKKESSLSQTLDGGGMRTPDLNHPTGPSTQDVVKGSLKGRRGRKKKEDATNAIAAPVMPQGSSEKKMATDVQEVSEKDGKRSPTLSKEAVSPSKEVKQMVITPRMSPWPSNNNKNLRVRFKKRLPGPRRSARLSGRCTFYGSDSDFEDGTDDDSLYSPETEAERPASLSCDENSEACMEHEISGSENVGCSSEIITEINQSCNDTLHRDNVALELGRSAQRGEGHFSVNMEINLERDCESNFADSSEILGTDVAKSGEGKQSSSGPQMLKKAHGKPKFCKDVDHLTIRKAEKFDNNSVFTSVNAQNVSTEVRRYMDLNMNGAEAGLETGSDACFSNSSIPAVNSLTSENNKNPNASAFEVENTNGGTCVPDDVLGKDTLAEVVVCDMSRAQMELKPATGRTQKKDSEKCLQQEDGLKVPVPSTCTPSSASKRKSGYAGYSKRRRKKRRGGCALTVRKNVEGDQQKELPSQRKLTALSWLIDAGILSENEMLVHNVKNDRTDHLRGLATRDGILCLCCKKIMTVSEFEHHAGSDICQPWYNICLESGKSLMQCQMEAWEKEKELRGIGFQMVGTDGLDPSDDTCGVCADGGNLICCDSCPSTFHQDCIMLKDFPEGRWHCPYCICTFCLAVEGGSDRVNQTLSLFTCQQCYRKYHWECTRENGQHKSLVESLLFCGKNCKEVDAGLFGLLGVVNKIEEGFSWTLLKRLDEHEELNSDQKLLFMMECNRKLSMALSVLNECFMPVVDLKTGVDLISHTVYNCGSNFRRLNYAGFYGAILEKDEEMISVALLRFHGRDLAEMPFVGTRPVHQRQGMCRRLLKAIEDLLSSLHVKKLVVPATPELLGTWATSFSFKPLEKSDTEEIRNFGLLVLPRTSLLQKSIPPRGKDGGESDPDGAGADVGKVAPGVQDSQGDVGKQTNSGGLPSGWDFESREDRDEQLAALPSQRGVETSSPAADARAVAPRLGSSVPVSETSPPARNPPAPNRGGAPAGGGGATCAPFSSLDAVVGGSSGCRDASGAGGDSVAASTDLAKHAPGDGVFPAWCASAFRPTAS